MFYFFAGTSYNIASDLSLLTMDLQDVPPEVRDPADDDMIEYLNLCEIFKVVSSETHCGDASEEF